MIIAGWTSCWASLRLGRASERLRPNVVFIIIIADDQSYRDFGFMGNRLVQTSNLDRLARRSARFPSGYGPTSVCRASLATLLTGLYPHQHGIHFNHPPPGLSELRKLAAAHYRQARAEAEQPIRRVQTLPRILARHGYVCLQTGKHWEGHYRTAGFTHGMTLGRPAAVRDMLHGTRQQDNGEWVAHGNGDAGLAIGRETMQPISHFLAEYAHPRPFFLWYAPFLPHAPFDAPERFYRTYAGRPVTGLSADDCHPFTGDSVAPTVSWDGASDVSRLAGKPVRLRFLLKDADVFSFRFR